MSAPTYPIAGIPRETRNFPDMSSKLRQLDQFPFAHAEFFDLYKARKIEDVKGKKLLVIKTLRAGRTSDPGFWRDVQRKLVHLGDSWGQLRHENIAPIYGVAYGVSYLPSIIVEYYETGSLTHAISLRSYSDEEKSKWVKQIASGMRYLHHRRSPIVHGDIRGSNVYLTSSGKCVIADTGLRHLMNTREFHMLDSHSSVRWTAPELLDINAPRPPEAVDASDRTIYSDVFAFAMTVVQIFSGARPFNNIHHDLGCIFRIHRGERPELPQFIRTHAVLSKLVQACWAQDWSRRPPMSEVTFKLGLRPSS